MTRLTIVQAAAFPFPSPQGSQVYVRGMARALARRGHRIVVACYGHGRGEPDPEYEVRRVPRVPGYRNLRAGPDLVKPWLDLALAGLLTRLAPGADVIHAHNYEAPIAAYAARARTGIPVVYNSHNTMGEELHRYFERRAARALARRVGAALDRAVPRHADATIAISQAAVPALKRLGARAVTCAPPGVWLDDLRGADGARAQARYKLAGRRWVIYAGNPDAYQDLEDLIDAVARLGDVGLLMVSASDLSAQRARARAIPAARARFVVEASWPAVRDLIAAADVAAIPRSVCSGFPIKLLNSLGLGVPTVCAAGSARPIAGVVAAPNHDPVGLAAALEALCRDDERRRALGEAARADVEANWSWAARAAALEEVYEGVLARGDRGR